MPILLRYIILYSSLRDFELWHDFSCWVVESFALTRFSISFSHGLTCRSSYPRVLLYLYPFGFFLYHHPVHYLNSQSCYERAWLEPLVSTLCFINAKWILPKVNSNLALSCTKKLRVRDDFAVYQRQRRKQSIWISLSLYSIVIMAKKKKQLQKAW